MLFICYPKCTTCQKAKKWLDGKNIEYTERHIVEDNPSYDELKEWYEMNEEEQLQLLATNGMLVKRPLIINEDKVLVGFKEAEWEEKLN